MSDSQAAHSSPETYLSLVTPVFNGEAFVIENIQRIVRALEPLNESFELIVVCDGCQDRTEARARSVRDPRVRVLGYNLNVGKGHAVTHGLAAARGRLVGWLDADLDIDATVILRAVERFKQTPVDAVIGSKRHPNSRVAYPTLRRLYSWGFQRVVAALFRFNARDTQVGAKVFRREMIDVVRPLLLIKRYAFDLEVLAVGAEFGFDRVEEIPIELDYRFSGTQINWRAVYRMLLDTMAIAYRIHIRHWYVRRFASLQRHRMDEIAHDAAVQTIEREEILAP
jgi:glycosyltransferase involved in cell wall biosynthesis